MNCEKCGSQLPSSAIICRECKHNNAKRAVSQWRARKTSDLQASEPAAVASSATTGAATAARFGPARDPKAVSRKEIADAALLRFPRTSRSLPSNLATAGVAEPLTRPLSQPLPQEDGTLPTWRDQVKEKVRLVREKRHGDEPVLEEEAQEPPPDKNPIVASAIKRIRRAEAGPPILVLPARNSAQPVLWQADEGLTEMPDFEEHARLKSPAQPPQRQKPLAPRVEERFHTTPSGETIPKRNTKPLSAPPPPPPAAPMPSAPLPKPPELRLTPKINPFKSTPKSDVQPITYSEPAPAAPPPKPEPVVEKAEKRESRRPVNPVDVNQFATEIIEMTYAVHQMPVPEARVATVWLRTLAGACDFEIVAAAYLPLFGAYATLNTALGGESLVVMAILMATCVFVYQLVMLLIAGRTFGMAMLNLTLVNTDDDQLAITRRQKMLRAWAASLAFIFLPINLLIIKLNPTGRGLPDILSGTTIAGR
jgi:uncharacterized RDD family membrane protein YckC